MVHHDDSCLGHVVILVAIDWTEIFQDEATYDELNIKQV